MKDAFPSCPSIKNVRVNIYLFLSRAENNTYRKSTEEKEEPEEVIIKDQSVEVERHNDMDKKKEVEEEEDEEGLLDLLDVREYLILKKEGEEGPEIRGGPVDALIVHASKVNKNGMVSLPSSVLTLSVCQSGEPSSALPP